VLAVLLATEVGVRGVESRLSLDLEHIDRIPTIARTTDEGDGLRLLFIGNSLTRRGIDRTVLRDGLGDPPLTVGEIFPDDTQVTEWDWLVRRYLVREGLSADVVIIPFAEDHLADSPDLHPRRLGRHFTDLVDVPRVFETDALDFGNRVDYLLARTSAAFAESERVRLRLLDLLVPKYRETAQELNRAVARAAAPEGAGSATAAAPSYTHLSSLLETLTGAGELPVFVAMPVSHPYAIDPNAAEAIRDSGGVLLDMRDTPGLPDERYVDGFHLDPEGARILSRALAARLLDVSRFRERLAQAERSGTAPAARVTPQRPPISASSRSTLARTS